jgi:hypothetical protein
MNADVLRNAPGILVFYKQKRHISAIPISNQKNTKRRMSNSAPETGSTVVPGVF